MRVSPVGWAFDTLEKTLAEAEARRCLPSRMTAVVDRFTTRYCRR